MFVDIISDSKDVVFFGGAGVSTESNIPDFRSEKGLFSVREVYGYLPEELLSYTFFMEEPDLFFRYYKENLVFLDARPNVAHVALAKLEKSGFLSAVVTQNVDGLHQLAGSVNVLELHGSNHRQYCVSCGMKYSLDYIFSSKNCEGFVPKCRVCGGVVRPDVVLYEESLDDSVVQLAISVIAGADCLIVGGTSLVVYPAAGFLKYFKGEKLVVINKSETVYDNQATVVFHESIGKVLSGVMEQLGL
ncbi:MAG: NAD-dependent protein deacylase [Candidatus Bathyarchaeota archaeon]|nr:NAD-dependent protein deacylase [Candidatus Termiticorpusculum sp.]MCL2868689.1 NAD-dependent protein deacylase [Candidatus Termiticorpusculum sp.]